MNTVEINRFNALGKLMDHLSEGSCKKLPCNFVFEYDNSGNSHSVHGNFQLLRILSQLKSLGINCRKISEKDGVSSYEINF